MLSWLAACSTSSGAGERDSARVRTGNVVAVGLLAELQPTRPDRCAQPSAEFDQQRGYVVMYRSPVGYRTRVFASSSGQQATVGDRVSFDDSACSAVPRRITADSD
ncbi:hypothetical protein [Niveibacterium sp.]|uniref:hypothetical protein n=1 Tax=Niveibacterium sp. TaxID=2017444 RepID=UPI0035B38926